MRSDGARPAHHVRESLVAGQIAELVALPVLLVVVVLFHHELRWGYLAGAIACLFASVLYFALFLALTRGQADVRAQQVTALVLSCLAIATLGLLELGTSVPYGTFLPGCVVVVVFMSTVGDRQARLATVGAAGGAVVVVGWAQGVGNAQLAAVTLVYATTAVLASWLTARAIGSAARQLDGRQSVATLNDALGEIGTREAPPDQDLMREIFRRGLPLVPAVVPAERISVFARNGDTDRFVAMATWPEGGPEVCGEPGARPEVVETLRTNRPVVGDDLCAVPIGHCSEGELIMLLRRTPEEEVDDTVFDGAASDDTLSDGAEALAFAFLRATNRANYLNGLRTESRTDLLTGLPNRRILYERIEIEMEHALRSDAPLSVALIDLDHFKQYNDRHGFTAGDTLLRSIAALFVSNIRGQDLVVRYGGEEFCLVMPDTDILGAHHLLDKLRDGGRDATSEFGITLSAGLTSWDGVEDTSSMIERADQALYRAKQTGRNRVVSIQSVTEY